MALRPLPIRDESRKDPATVYDPRRGGWYPPKDNRPQPKKR
ncbi:hypothetical protein ACFSJS_22620 [Streptomyces desertarenae]|uniref:Uncharacterized protein n=1 Tax=Streptomyces desertarenae TaxID=2666184 RepID=A0ABW4PQ47_9ACTN